VDLFFLALAFGLVWLLWLSAPRRGLGAIYFFVVLPILSFILLRGVPSIGLARISTDLWGGILVTVVLATIGIVVSLPVGIFLALGRRSKAPVVKLLSVIFIEFVRGVPLITVLFMASVMLPLFVPEPLLRTSSCGPGSALRCLPRPIWRKWYGVGWPRFRGVSTKPPARSVCRIGG
jgi:general L-amino acid transport system permease protein